MAVIDTLPIFHVIIESGTVAVRKIKPKKPGYRQARKKMILRQRDAIEFFQRLKAADKGFDGVYSFQFVDSAKTFAMLYLEAVEARVQDAMNRVQAYDGTADSSGG